MMKKRLTALGVAAGLMGGVTGTEAGDVQWSVRIGVGNHGAGVAVGVVRPQPFVVVAPFCQAPPVVRRGPPVRVIVPPPVVVQPPRIVVAHPFPPPRRVVVRHRGFWHRPVVVVPAGRHGHGTWKPQHRHGHH